MRRAALWLLLGLFLAAGARAADRLADRVIILANAADPDSLRLADYYAAQRHIPRWNIIALRASTAETISWPEFIATIYQPLQDELIQRGLIDAFSTSLTDAYGRKKYGISGHRLAYLVVCKGIPLRIQNDPELYFDNPPLTDKPQFRTNQAAVDSELSLLAQSGYNINAFVPNPLYQNDQPTVFDEAQVVKVGRLDGPSYDDARQLVDHAIEAERTGLLGRYYIDLGGPVPEGDHWLEQTAKLLAGLGFDGDVDHAAGTLPASARFDAPVFYFGWYAANLNGPFAVDGFRFPPGAIAMHIHSYSAATLRSATQGWCGPLVARGVTATLGNVFEPYLQLTHRPQLLVQALAAGATLGDAAYYALPVLSWESILVGDPLYRPFAVSEDAQWRERGKLPPLLASYAVMRRADLLRSQGESAKALQVLRAGWREFPSLALGIALARQLQAAGDHAGAARALGFAAQLKTFQPTELPLAREAAGALAADGDPATAVKVYRTMLAGAGLTGARRADVLREASAAAAAANDAVQTMAWKTELNALSTASGT